MRPKLAVSSTLSANTRDLRVVFDVVRFTDVRRRNDNQVARAADEALRLGAFRTAGMVPASNDPFDVVGSVPYSLYPSSNRKNGNGAPRSGSFRAGASSLRWPVLLDQSTATVA
ncbi:hypothetical protein RM533_06595 [Croceicoccus sp. F390]|uniref:Uncharacterized protein n=1 Tax=Croceicoccus esteveae TaxID=3075597 RepID=A0ABU2ZHI8_9SPHN|nr:hypothetical protein [Croceicoccus sp. F390]MDT0575850.1 hypothetical protein [Croceicoccus sp. F390]